MQPNAPDESNDSDHRNLLSPVFLDADLAGKAYPRPRTRQALPLGPCLVPRFVRAGSFWVPGCWLHAESALDEALECPARGPLLRDNAPIDFESLVELGQVELFGARRHGMLTVPFTATGLGYRPEIRAHRRDSGGAHVILAAPPAVLLVPRRKPRTPSGSPDLRDVVEIVCVSWERGALVARPLSVCWRFALAWEPPLPTAEMLLAAVRARDVEALTRPAFHVDGTGTAIVGRLAHDVPLELDPEVAPGFLEAFYEQHSEGLARVCTISPSGEQQPQPVLVLGVNAAGKHGLSLAFNYGGFRLDPWGLEGSSANDDRERFVIRDLDTEIAANFAVSKCLGKPVGAFSWALSERQLSDFHAFANEMREHRGWAIEVIAGFTSDASVTRRPMGLASEAIFRKLKDVDLDARGEFHYQEYERTTRDLEDRDAQEMAKAIRRFELVDPEATPPRNLTPEEIEAATLADATALDALMLAARVNTARVHRNYTRLLEVKRREVVRLQHVAQQSASSVDAFLDEAESIVALRGHRLKAHQRDAFVLLLRRLHLGTGAILALPVGYGKTLVALLVGIALQRLGIVTEPLLWIGTKSTLVSLRNDIAKFLPNLRVNDFTGPDRRAEFDDIDVAMTSYDIVRREVVPNPETGALQGALVGRRRGLRRRQPEDPRLSSRRRAPGLREPGPAAQCNDAREYRDGPLEPPRVGGARGLRRRKPIHRPRRHPTGNGARDGVAPRAHSARCFRLHGGSQPLQPCRRSATDEDVAPTHRAAAQP
jgi:hypothetical protein